MKFCTYSFLSHFPPPIRQVRATSRLCATPLPQRARSSSGRYWNYRLQSCCILLSSNFATASVALHGCKHRLTLRVNSCLHCKPSRVFAFLRTTVSNLGRAKAYASVKPQGFDSIVCILCDHAEMALEWSPDPDICVTALSSRFSNVYHAYCELLLWAVQSQDLKQGRKFVRGPTAYCCPSSCRTK